MKLRRVKSMCGPVPLVRLFGAIATVAAAFTWLTPLLAAGAPQAHPGTSRGTDATPSQSWSEQTNQNPDNRELTGGTGGTMCDRPGGADVIVGDLLDVTNYPSLNGIEAFAVGTTSCNVGSENLLWIASTNEHPVIAQTMFRLKDDRFEQIGQSWLKHGFTALTQNLCGCGCNGQGGSVLGVGCSDPYCCGLNGSQNGLGPKWQVNAFTGNYVYPFQHGDQGATGDSTYKRLQVAISDLDPALDGGGQYFVAAQYVTSDDAAAGNQDNNSSYRPIIVSGSGNSWNISLTGSTQRERPAIRAWRDTDTLVTETDVRIPGEGLMILSAKVTNLGTGFWHYEYALQNINSDRSVGSFQVPISPGALVQNIGFHDVNYHSGEPFDGTDWPGTYAGSVVSWSTDDFAVNAMANALRWGTLYNFRFDANVQPSSTESATIGLFKPGAPAEIPATTQTPAGMPDCNGNGIADPCDLNCGLSGGACDVPGCGGSLDCNSNATLDECETDCNGSGVPDDCDITDGTSLDCNGNQIPDDCETFAESTITAVLVANGLDSPVYVVAPAGDFNRLFIVELSGRIRILDLAGGAVLGTPFLDIASLISLGGEQGLFSLAFSPTYATDGFFYVNYTNPAGDTVIARYTASANPDQADATSAVILKTIPQDFPNHNGGQMQFGPDGMLYVGMGDGGSGLDPLNRAQSPNSLLGKMLRLDVSNPPTYVPADNPFLGNPGTKPEIWALGLRNPWRFSFDRLTGDLYIADVGQDDFEEIDFQPANSLGGENYGWRCMEASSCTGETGCICNDLSLTLPIRDIPHVGGVCSLSGGYVYRGCALPDLSGSYFYADLCAGWIRSLRYVNGQVTEVLDRTAALTPTSGPITSPVSFGEDGSGELYVVSLDGAVFKIVSADGLFVCGNDVVEPGEDCDDGNTAGGDGCSATCRFENGSDGCLTATPICSSIRPGTSVGATNDGDASCGVSSASPDVWYTYYPTVDGILTADTCNLSTFDTVVSIHTTCPGGPGNELACDDNGCSGDRSTVSAALTAGQPYYIRVSGNGGAQGNFELSVNGPACQTCPLLLFEDHFETEQGWTVNNVNLSSGPWERGFPLGGGFSGDPTDDFDGNGQCYLTGNVVGNSNVDGGPTQLISPTMDLNRGAIELRYAYWFASDDPAMADGLSVEASTNDGVDWTLLAVHNVSDTAWHTNVIELNDLITPSTTTRIRFSIEDNPDNSIVEAAVDAVVLESVCFPDCNGNGVDDALDISIGNSGDCNGNAQPDECDLTFRLSADCAGGPVGVIDGGAAIFGSICFACHNDTGTGGLGFPGPNIRNHSRAAIWNMLLPPTNHPGGAFPGFTQQDFADLEAFLADGGSRGRPDRVPDECQTDVLSDCDFDTVLDACELEVGSQSDLNYDGDPDDCVSTLCDAPLVLAGGSRYLYITPAPSTGTVALQIAGDVNNAEVSCVLSYVQANGTLGGAPFFQTPSAWGTAVVFGNEVMPGTIYNVNMDCRSALSDAATAETWPWGETNNVVPVDLDDILCVLEGFSSNFEFCSLEAVDMAPCLPSGDVDIDDVLGVLEGFAGNAIPCAPPCGS